MDPYKSFKLLSQTLQAYSQNVPFPGGLALESAARLILVITAFMEMKETERRDRERAERLLQRAGDISNLIMRHQQELRRDQMAASFIVRFISTMAAIDAFVSEIHRAMGRKGIIRNVAFGAAAMFGNAAGQGSKQQFDEYGRELDSVHLDFQSHLASNKAAMGPHQLIKHPDIQVFWKYRLTNVLEVQWNYFWVHFLDEYPFLKKIFSGKEGLQMVGAFERLASCTKKEVVSPQEINRVFQPTNESMETIVYNCLGIELNPDDPTNLLDGETQGQVQQWKGYWVQYSHKGQMDLELFVTNDHQVLGSGVDEIERFTIEGTFQLKDGVKKVDLMKQYYQAHSVHYQGMVRKVSNGELVMKGTWSISNDCKGIFKLRANEF